jgi:ABC-type polysaccharide/polyol phosphate export permease
VAAGSSAYLAYQLIRRDLSIRFTGSALGFAWAVLQPLGLIILYWFIFGIMLPGGKTGQGGGGDYVYFLISGLLPWLGFSEALVRGTTSVVENAQIVKRLPFRSEILVLVPSATAILFELVALILFFGLLLFTGRLAGAIWIIPVAIALQFALQFGLSLILAVAYVVFRDVLQLLSFGLSVLFFLSPILFEVRPAFAMVFRWNPLTPLMGLYRFGTIGGHLPSWGAIAYLVGFALTGVVLGLSLFRRAQSALVDAI